MPVEIIFTPSLAMDKVKCATVLYAARCDTFIDKKSHIFFSFFLRRRHCMARRGCY